MHTHVHVCTHTIKNGLKMSYLTSWLVWQFSSKIALMTAGWQSCSCLVLNGKTQLEFESVALKWNCLLQAELGHGHGAVWARGERRRPRLWGGQVVGGSELVGQGSPMCCYSGKGTSLLFSKQFKELLLLPGFCSPNPSIPDETCWVWGWQGAGIQQLMGTE